MSVRIGDCFLEHREQKVERLKSFLYIGLVIVIYKSKTMTILFIILITAGFVFSTVMLIREQKLRRLLLEERVRLKKENSDGNTGNG